MSNVLTKTLGMKNELICFSFALLSTACSPMSFSDATQAAALQQGVSPISSGEIAAGPAEVVSGGQPAQASAPVVVTPSQSLILDDVPFTAEVGLPTCVDVTQDSFAFDLISGADSKVVSAQVTSLPTVNGKVDYENYSVYAVYQADGRLHGEQAHIEATIDNSRVYGYFNCNIQTSVINRAAEEMKAPWSGLVPRTKIHVLVEEMSVKPVGIMLKNQNTNQITLRCFK